MMTRFQSRALPQYTPQQYQSPVASIWQGLAMWYSLPASTRNRIADWFTSFGETTEPEQVQTYDSYEPEREIPTKAVGRGGETLTGTPGYNGPMSWNDFEIGKKLAAIEDPDRRQSVYEWLKGLDEGEL